MASSGKKFYFNFILHYSLQAYALNMCLKWSRVSCNPIPIDLLEVIYHNRESLYFVFLMDMLDVNKFYVNDYVFLLQQFCFSIIDQQPRRICITRTIFFRAKFCKKVWSILPAVYNSIEGFPLEKYEKKPV